MLFLIILFLFICFLISRLTCGKTRSSACLIGKTAIITGANSGIGYQTTLNLASRGCRIIMADISDMEISKQKIIKFTNNSNIFTKQLDLGSFKSIRKFAQDILTTEDRLDILINNAGIGGIKAGTKTVDGLHPVIQINYLGHFLLTHLLVPLLKKSAPARIVFTSSLMSYFNNLRSDNLNYQNDKEWNLFEGYQDTNAYGNSKVATIIASDLFAEKLKEFNITSNSLHPGLVQSPIYGNFFSINANKIFEYFTKILVTFFGKDTWEGSQTVVHLAVSKKLEKVTGKFFIDCRNFFKPITAYRKNTCQDIWSKSEEFVGLREEERLLD